MRTVIEEARESLVECALLATLSPKISKVAFSLIGEDVIHPLPENPIGVWDDWLATGEIDDVIAVSVILNLRRLGVQSVQAEYSGGGDSGDMDNIAFTPPISPETPVFTFLGGKLSGLSHFAGDVDTIQGLVEACLWICVDRSGNSGWEDNDGGQGSLEIDVSKGTALLCHENHSTTYKEMSASIEKADLPPEIIQILDWMESQGISKIELSAEDGDSTHIDEFFLSPNGYLSGPINAPAENMKFLQDYVRSECRSHPDIEAGSDWQSLNANLSSEGLNITLGVETSESDSEEWTLDLLKSKNGACQS